MLNWVIDFSLKHRALVIFGVLALAAVGGIALNYLNIDAFPDTTPVQVQINTATPSLTPEEVETQVTAPIEQALSGLPGLERLRSVSKFGLSQVAVTFQDGIDIYFARQLINERLNTVTLPDGSSREFPSGACVRDVAESISPRLAKAALAGVVDGKLVDLTYPLDHDASVRIVTEQSPEALPLYRHSTAHLLAAAVTNLFPGVQCGIGPATDEGFFYDFVVPKPFEKLSWNTCPPARFSMPNVPWLTPGS